MSCTWRTLLALGAGAVLNLAFAPFGLWPVAVLVLAAFFALIDDLQPRAAALTGGTFGVAFFAFGTYWLYTSIHGFGQAPIWLTLLLQTALVILMASYLGLLAYLTNRLWPHGWVRAALALPALWMLLEWLRGWLFSGFPWLSIGYAFIDSPLAGWAPVGGVYAVTWSAALMAAAVRYALSREIAVRSRLLALASIVLLIALPWALLHIRWTEPVAAPLSVAIVQGAVPQDLKWQESNRQATVEKYTRLTREALGAKLIVWPEAALPELANELGPYLDALKRAARAHGSDLAVGLLRYDDKSSEFHNGLLVMSDADGWYYKRHLVPFGEYFPVPSFVRSWLRLMSLPYVDMSPGLEYQPVLRAAGQPLGLSICYEDAYGSEQIAVLESATLLVNVTNNAWYGDSTAPHQHLQISRFRALEAGRYLVRAANDGITAVIGPQGEVIARAPQFQESVLRAAVVPRFGHTPYSRMGNYTVVSAAFLTLGIALWRRPRVTAGRGGNPAI
jgi:apolipoprotein N-acyltransferase